MVEMVRKGSRGWMGLNQPHDQGCECGIRDERGHKDYSGEPEKCCMGMVGEIGNRGIC